MSDRKEKHIVITMQSGLKPKNYPVKTLWDGLKWPLIIQV